MANCPEDKQRDSMTINLTVLGVTRDLPCSIALLGQNGVGLDLLWDVWANSCFPILHSVRPAKPPSPSDRSRVG